jgi:hypothetical protein
MPIEGVRVETEPIMSGDVICRPLEIPLGASLRQKLLASIDREERLRKRVEELERGQQEEAART